MAKYNDDPLLQIVDDLNFQNPDTIPAPLLVSQCSIANPVGIPSEGEMNTTATLTVVGNENYPSGTLTVKYRRLQGPILYAATCNIDLLGAEEQDFTLRQLITKLEIGINAGLIAELIPEIAANLDVVQTYSRDLSIAALITRADSIKFITGPTILVKTVKIDIAKYQTPVILAWGEDENFETLYPSATTDAKARIVAKFLQQNNLPLGLLPADLTWGTVTPVAQGSQNMQLTLTVREDHPLYTGTGTFKYQTVGFGEATNAATGSYNPTFVNDGTTVMYKQFLQTFFTTNNMYYNDADWVDEPLPLRRAQQGLTPPKYVSPLPVYYGVSGNWLFHSNTQLYPLDSIVEVDMLEDTFNPMIFTYSNQSGVPITIQVLEAPAGYTGGATPTLVAYTSTLYRAAVMWPAGHYKVRAIATDSYDAPGSFPQNFCWGSNVNLTVIRVTKLVKHKSYNAQNLFQTYGPPALASIAADAFSEASYLVRADWMFKGCTALTAIPAGLFDACTRLTGMHNMFLGCSGITAIPDRLFAGKYRDPGATLGFGGIQAGPFCGTSVTTVNKTIYADSEYAYLPPGLFAGMPLLTSIPDDLLEGVGNYDNNPKTDELAYLFQNSGITHVPDNFFDTYFAKRLGPTRFFWSQLSLQQMFEGTQISTVPAELLHTAGRLRVNVSGMFTNSKISDVPVGFFGGPVTLDALQFYNRIDIFKGCTELETIDRDVFKANMPWTSLGGLFQDSGLTVEPFGLMEYFPACKSVLDMFRGCHALTSISSGFLASSNSNQITNASGFMAGTGIAALPTQLFWVLGAVLTDVSYAFEGCATLTEAPNQLLQLNTELTTLEGLFKGAGVQSGSWTSGFLTNQSKVTNASSMFENCTSFTVVPDNLFGGLVKCVNYAKALKGSGAALLPNVLFSDCQETSVVVTSMFENCPGLTVIPDDLFYPLHGIYDMGRLFAGCPNIVSIGRLANKTLGAQGINVGGFTTHNADIALADNLIVSSAPQNLIASDAIAGFNFMLNNTTMTKNITNLFGANIRPYIGFSFKNMPITGVGADFITKHALTNAPNGLFYNCTTLTDYASLPAWAKATV